MLAICNVTHYWTQGFLTTITGIASSAGVVEESASCIGGVASRALRDVILPSIAPTLISVFFFMFMRSMVTLSAVIFLVTASVSVAVGVDHAPRRGRLRLTGGSLRGVHDGGGGGRIGADETVSAVARATSALDHPAEPGTERSP